MVTLVGHALLGLQELKGYVNAGPGSAQDDNLRSAINAATALIETRLGRQLVTRLSAGAPAAITEYHSPGCYVPELHLRDWPLITVTSVHESDATPRVYDSTTLLTTSQYEFVPSVGLLRRVESGLPQWWADGNRTVKVVYTAGYRDVGGVATAAELIPYDLKQVALFVSASVWKELDRRGWGVSSVSDETGSVTRFMGYLPPSIDGLLAPHARVEFSRTWERTA